jgi:phage tail-like protein
MPSRAEDPLVSFSFAIEVQGVIEGFFSEVSGLGSETEVAEHKVVTKNGKTEVVRKIPGRNKWGDITLKRGITSIMDVWAWRKKVEDGDIQGARKNGSIMMMNQSGDIVAQWDFVNAWPSKVTGPSIQADSNALGVEEMTLVHEGITRVQ